MPPNDRDDRRNSNSAGGATNTRGASGNAAAFADGSLGEVYFEFRPVGSYMRVNAIHAATGKETFVLGPLNASRGDLQILAMRKLKNLLGRAG